MAKEITRQILQELANKVEVSRFFEELGYSTDRAFFQPKSELNISKEADEAIESIDQIASREEDWAIRIYLVKLKAERKIIPEYVRVGVAKAFRDKDGDYLLVFTIDYTQIDVVLVERTNAPVGTIQNEIIEKLRKHRVGGVRPRTLTIDRNNPDEVTLRVLNLLAHEPGQTVYTLSERLRSAYDVAYWSEPYFNNRSLFSDYYLNHDLPNTEEWKTAAAEVSQVLKKIKKLYADPYDDYIKPSNTTETVQKQLVEPILSMLGFVFLPREEGISRDEKADYTLYSKDSEGKATGEPLALCLAYRWKRDLDRQEDNMVEDQEIDSENPAAQVITLLEQQKVEWAILTNGKTWRLYSAKAQSRATNYYEIDMAEIATRISDQETAFKYFWVMFREQAFLRTKKSDDGLREISMLDFWIDESTKFAYGLESRLKWRVFKEVFPYFADGFVQYAKQNGLLPQDLSKMEENERESEMKSYFDGTLTFLYRLLILLYAESRSLLPVRESSNYYEKSLEKLKKEIVKEAGKVYREAPGKIRNHYKSNSTRIYDILLEVFGAIDRGSKELNIPIYNGGLFITQPKEKEASNRDKKEYITHEDEVAVFLLDHKIPDQYLVLGLDRLAREADEKSGLLVQVDYKSLGVRQLGSIYEGLLEFKLRIALNDIAFLDPDKDKSKRKVVPIDEAELKHLSIAKEVFEGEQRLVTYKKGDIYLDNDQHERKISGSYYTPDYIVKYIVKQTVMPVLEKKLEDLRQTFRDAQQILKNHKKWAKEGKGSLQSPEEETYWHFNSPDVKVTLVERFFDIKVLDPAMGSGHFLVEAVDQITDKLAAFLTEFRNNPITTHLKKEREKIEAGMADQEVSIDIEQLTNNVLLKRHVLKHCIYGVDLKPMAVELAKVSVWLNSFTVGAPFSFLDPHLKCGNSLLGVSLRDVEDKVWSNKAARLLDGAALMRQLSQGADITYEDILSSHTIYEDVQKKLNPYKILLNLWASRYFGNEYAHDVVKFCAEQIFRGEYDTLDKTYKDAIDKAQKLARQDDKNFFHWHIEFPEVFLGKDGHVIKGSGGFDVVVGNPPYDELSEQALGRILDEQAFLAADHNYRILGGGRLNWYHYFIILALTNLHQDGMHGFIVPMSLMSDQFTLSLRQWLLENYQLVAIEAFPQKDNPKKRVFFEAKLPTCIYFTTGKKDTQPFRVRVHPENMILENSPTYYPDLMTLRTLNSTNLSIPLVSEKGWQILQKIFANPRLGNLLEFGAKPTSGEIVFNQQFRKYLTNDDRYTLVLRGSHVQRYELLDEAKQGEPVYLKKDLYIREARQGSKAFDHLKERVVYQEGAAIDNWRRVIATLLPAGLICGHKICYFTDYKVSKYTLLAVFDSKLVDWYVTALSTNNSLSAYLVGSIRFPIFKMATSTQEFSTCMNEMKRRYKEYIAKPDKTNLREMCIFVEEQLKKVPEQSNVIHDLLSYLAEEMLRLNKEKQDEQKDFLAFLERKLRIRSDKRERVDIISLKSGGDIMNYIGDYQKDKPHMEPKRLLKILQQNQDRFSEYVSFNWKEIEERYEESLKKLLLIKETLRNTDEVIDEVVYRLYGLTEEEIGIVEGRA